MAQKTVDDEFIDHGGSDRVSSELRQLRRGLILQEGQMPVLIGQDDITNNFPRPRYADCRVVPADADLGLRVIVVRTFVNKIGDIGKDDKTVGKPGGYIHLSMRFVVQDRTGPSTEGR